jgi:hypothetical protein
MYHVIYDDYGVLDHAVRYADEALVRQRRDSIADLFGRGEPIGGDAGRRVAVRARPGPATQ